jgi:hypothetical protein
LELHQLNGVMFQSLLGIPPAFVGTEGHQMQVQGNILVVQGILPNPEEPVAAGPGANYLQTPA